MTSGFGRLLLAIALLFPLHTLAEAPQVIDDAGEKLSLPAPAQRIVSLAPHLTELLFAAGAGDKIVGTVHHSDWPAEAATIPLIGDSFNLDIEAIVRLQPDLVVLWQSGNRAEAYEKLKELGLTVYRSEPDTLEKIASTIVRFGQLAASEAVATQNSTDLLKMISSLRDQYARRSRVRVFYQFWDRPIFTVNAQHLISHIIDMCGGQNIFADLSTLTPQINPEAVLERNPEVIIGSGENASPPDWLDDWKAWPEMAANRNGQLYSIPPDYIQRHTSRVITGATMMCEFIDRARKAQTG